MTRRAPLPKITECVEKQKTENKLSRLRLLRGAYPFLVVCILCLAHIRLQFARVDMLMQQSQLQTQERMLRRDEAVLERQNEALDVDALKSRARIDLNMREVGRMTADLMAKVPAELQEKYEQPLRPNNGDVLVAEMRANRPQTLKEALWSLVDSGRAVAAVSSGNR